MTLDFEAILGLLFFVVFVVLPLVQGNKKKQQQQQRRQEDARSAQQPVAPPQAQASTQHPARSRAAGPLTSQQPTTLSGRPYQAPAQPRQPTTISGPPPPAAPPPDSGDPLLATIEEIRRRVREAQEREDTARRLGGGQPRDLTQPAAATASGPAVTTASGQPRQGSLVGTDPFESTLVSAPGRTLSGGTYDPRRGGAQTPPRSAQTPRPITPPSALGREGVSDELRVERLQPVKPTVRPSVSERDPKLIRPFARGLLRPGETDARIGAGSLLGTDSDSIMRGLIWHEVLSEPWILKHRKRRNPGAPAR